MSNVKKRTFGNTAAALIVFDSTAAARTHAWSRAETAEDIAAAERADTAALRAVRDAYHRDTADINSVANCQRIDIDSMRRISRDSTPATTELQDVDLDDVSDVADAPAPR